MPGTMDRYCMPVFAQASLVLGWALSRHTGFQRMDRLWRNIVLAGFVLCSVSAVVCFFVVDLGITAFVLVVLTICLTIIFIQAREVFRSVIRLCLLSSALAMIVMFQYALFVTPSLGKPEPGRLLINAELPAEETLYMFASEDTRYQNFLFYVRRPLRYILHPDKIAPEVRYILIKQGDWKGLKDHPGIVRRSPKTLGRFNSRGKVNFRLIELQEPIQPAAAAVYIDG